MAIGVAIGTAGALALTRVMAGLLYEVRVRPMRQPFAGVAPLILLARAGACAARASVPGRGARSVASIRLAFGRSRVRHLTTGSASVVRRRAAVSEDWAA